MYCDIVGSTELSGRLEPETYRELMRGYRDACRDVIETRFDGHIVRHQGRRGAVDLRLPRGARERRRARGAGGARAGASGARADRSPARPGESLDLRVGIHHGPVYLDFDEDDIYGLAANVGARLRDARRPGHGRGLGRGEAARRGPLRSRGRREPQVVKGVAEPLQPFRVVGERAVPAAATWRRRWSSARTSSSGFGRPGRRSPPATTDRATGLLIRGDAGVGKSRLVATLDRRGLRAAELASSTLHGSPFHVDAGFHPVRRLVETRCGIRDDASPPSASSASPASSTDPWARPSETVPFLAPVLGIDPSAGYEQATTEGRKLEEQVARGGCSTTSSRAPADSPRSSSRRTCTGSTTPRGNCWPS